VLTAALLTSTLRAMVVISMDNYGVLSALSDIVGRASVQGSLTARRAQLNLRKGGQSRWLMAARGCHQLAGSAHTNMS
jgi:hypothetical protein